MLEEILKQILLWALLLAGCWAAGFMVFVIGGLIASLGPVFILPLMVGGPVVFLLNCWLNMREELAEEEEKNASNEST